jgi:protease I
MSNELNGKRVAILVADGFEQVELTKPRQALEDAGAKTDLISPMKGEVESWIHFDKAAKYKVDVPLDSAQAGDYDALLLPGGVANPDQLRMNPKAVEFVRSFVQEHKPIASICHGLWMLVEADAVRGRKVTSWPSIQTDLRNAGAQWVDQQVVRDENLVTSRKPDDIPAFNKEMIANFQQGAPAGAGSHQRRR